VKVGHAAAYAREANTRILDVEGDESGALAAGDEM
jgi:hypothetical protein